MKNKGDGQKAYRIGKNRKKSLDGEWGYDDAREDGSVHAPLSLVSSSRFQMECELVWDLDRVRRRMDGCQ